MANNKKYVELLWHQKYDKLDLGEKIPIEKPNLPFQIVEIINKPQRLQKGLGEYEESLKHWPENYPKDWKNLLVWGDNKLVMSSLIKQGWAGKINLIYIDPPFFTGADFTVRTNIGDEQIEKEPSIIEELAYKDTWSGGIASYLKYMYERLVLMRELLAENGSIYVHLDWHVGHYVKVMMDEIFGYENFVNDITRIKCNPKNFERQAYGNIKDMILFYSKTGNHIWNNPKAPMSEMDIERLFKKTDKDGRRYTTIPLHAPGETRDGPTGQPWREMKPPKGRHWRSPPNVLEELDKQGLIEWSKTGVPRKKIYADEKDGKKIQDILEFKDLHNPIYPTEKNIELLRLLIEASSNKDSIVLDCFCGSGTTLKAAQDLGRTWIGIDESEEAIKVALQRLTLKQKKLFTDEYEFEYLEQR